jgi:hypothetical protein
MFHEECYDCGGGWQFQWPVRFERKFKQTLAQMLASAQVTNLIADGWHYDGYFSKNALIHDDLPLGTSLNFSFYVASGRPLQDNVDDK